MIMKGRAISPGYAEGEAITYGEPFSFLGGVDGKTGKFNVRDGNIDGKVFLFPNGKGSTVGSYVVYDLMVQGHAPAALVNRNAETVPLRFPRCRTRSPHPSSSSPFLSGGSRCRASLWE